MGTVVQQVGFQRHKLYVVINYYLLMVVECDDKKYNLFF